MEAGKPQEPRKRVNGAPQEPRAVEGPPMPPPLPADDVLIEKTPLQKRQRRNLTDAERLEVAATRKRGACEEHRRKKEKCRHPPKQYATGGIGTDGATPLFSGQNPRIHGVL